jgi:hypothetical protein
MTNDRTSVRGEAGEPYDHFGNFATAIAGVNSPDARMDDNDYAVGLLVDIDKQMGPVALGAPSSCLACALAAAL